MAVVVQYIKRNTWFANATVKAREAVGKEAAKVNAQDNGMAPSSGSAANLAPVVSHLVQHCAASPPPGCNDNVSEVVAMAFSDGKVICTPPERFKESLVAKFVSDSYYQSQHLWVKEHFAKNGLCGANVDIVKKPVLSQYNLILSRVLDQRLREVLAGEKAVESAFLLQLWQADEYFASVSTSPRCLPECRLTLEGSEVCAGVLIEKTPGRTLRENLSAISSMTVQQFLSLAEQHGFFVCIVPGQLVIIPAGYIVILAAATAGWD